LGITNIEVYETVSASKSGLIGVGESKSSRNSIRYDSVATLDAPDAPTVTVQVAVFSPSVVFAVMTALPADLAVTRPSEETDATVSALDDQVTLLSVALVGLTAASSCAVSPTVRVTLVLSRLTPVTGTVVSGRKPLVQDESRTMTSRQAGRQAYENS